MDDLRIHIQMHSRYQVFDSSGQLPFSIVFGLCRRSPADTDPRSLFLKIAGSALDVPYALAHGLLAIYERAPKDAEVPAEVDLDQLSRVATEGADFLSLPSPVNRTENWRDALTVYQYHIKANSELASILKPGKEYSITLASEDLCVKNWAYGDQKQFVDNDAKSSHDFKAARLISNKRRSGSAIFTVVERLSWPPRVETRMRLCTSYPSSNSALPGAKQSRDTALEVSVINTGPEPVTVQTRGHQRILIPWGPFQPEPDAENDRLRIIDAAPHKPPTSSLQVVHSATGQLVERNKQRVFCTLSSYRDVDLRPEARHLVVLKPGIPIIRNIDIGMLVNRLEDGLYKIRMRPRGCRWWLGEVEKEQDGSGRLPSNLWESFLPPLILESRDEVELRIKNGKVDQNI